MIDSLFAENFERSDQKENTNKQQINNSKTQLLYETKNNTKTK